MNEEDVDSSHSKEAEKGEVSMIWRALLNGDNKYVERKNFFKTRCKCEGNVCSVIIDSGSIGNLVSEEMVKIVEARKKKILASIYDFLDWGWSNFFGRWEKFDKI